MSKLGNVVSAIAPALGNVLNLALPGSSLVVSALASMFGGTQDNTDDLANKIAQDPDAALKLLDYQNRHLEELQRIAASDRSSARDREKNIVQSTGKRDWVVNFIALFLVFGFFALIMIVAFTNADNSDRDILYLLTGQLSSAFLYVVSYYFGSTVPVKEAKPEMTVKLPEPAETKSG